MDQEQAQVNEQGSWEYNDQLDSQSEAQIAPIEWTASEYISHEKDMPWYLAVSVASIVIAAVIFFITRELIASITIVVVAFSAVFFAARKPATKTYKIGANVIIIDDKRYSLNDFKSFSIVDEGAIDSIWFKPLARMKPMLIIYFAPEDEQKIAETLSNYLPYENRELDALDRMTRRMRF